MSHHHDRPHTPYRPRVSRREFIAASGAGIPLVGPAGILFAASQARAQGGWDHEADVVVVGTGAAGCAAALFAKEEGAQVLVLEKGRGFGGTTMLSGAIHYIPNNPIMRAQGIVDVREECLRYFARTSFPDKYRSTQPLYGLSPNEYDLLAAFYDGGYSTIHRLTEMSCLQSLAWHDFEGKNFPDYYSDLAENKAPRGRALVPKAREGGNALPKGAELIGQLRAGLEARRVPVLMGHRVQRVVLNKEKEVIGVEALNPDGRGISVRAAKGVVFASGGFTHNQHLREQLRGPVFSGCGPLTNEGDFVAIAASLGAQLHNMGNAWWYPQILELALISTATGLSGGSAGDSMILVNRHGVRVVNEKAVYHDRNQVHFTWDSTHHEYVNRILFMIFDQRTRVRFAQHSPIPSRDTSPRWLLSAATLSDLGGAIDRRLVELSGLVDLRLDQDFTARLKRTIEDFNRYANTGIDLEFARGKTAHELAYHGPRAEDNARPNPTMYPFSSDGPYYAMMICGGTLDTNGGPKINPKAQVVGWNDQPIPGLYGAGNCVASPAGQAYWGAGATIGLALVFGAIAGRHAATEVTKKLDES